MTRLQRLLSLSIALILPLAARAQHPISTVAGGGPDNSAAALTHAVGGPVAVAKDAAGNVYIVDGGQSRVIKLDSAGHLTLFAGNGSGGFSGEGGLANQAQLNTPTGIAIDGAGNVFIADNDNGVIREVPGPTPPAGKLTGHIYTVA